MWEFWRTMPQAPSPPARRPAAHAEDRTEGQGLSLETGSGRELPVGSNLTPAVTDAAEGASEQE